MPKPKLFIVPTGQTRRLQAPNNLPGQLTPLIGRETEVEAALNLLRGAKDQGPDVRLLTFTGPGGVGKTRLALQVAETLLEEEGLFEEGVFFVELAPITDTGLVVQTIASILQVREVPGTPLGSTLKAHLHGKRILLVLDNFEQILPAGVTLSELLAACPELKVLVTSRSALRLRIESEFVVSPLDLPEPRQQLSAEEASRYEAVSLFVQRARAARPNFELTGSNASAVAEICRRVDGLPLGIELVAAYAGFLSPKSILARLKHPLRLLAGSTPDSPDRHQTMRDTIEWSYKLLNEKEQRLFRRTSVFVGGFGLRAAEGVCNEVADVNIEAEHPGAIDVLMGLKSLLDKNLVRVLEPKLAAGQAPEGEDPHLKMLETVREYAWEQLVASGEAEAMQRRHADYYLQLAEQVEPALEGKELTIWQPRLDRDHDNLRAALSWLLEQGEAGQREAAEDALWLLVRLRVFWDGRAHLGELMSWIERALMQTGDEATALRSRAMRRGSIVARKQGDYPKARAWAEQAVAIARELGDKREITDALSAMATVELVRGNYSTARSLMEETLAVYRELGVDVFIASTLNNLGEVARYQGDYQGARGFYEESLGLFRGLEDQTGIIESVGNWGDSMLHLGKFQEARAALLEGLALAEEINAPARAARILAGLSILILAEEPALSLPTRRTTGITELPQGGNQDTWGMKQAVRLFGLAAALLERSGQSLDSPDQVEFDHNIAAARARLSEDAFTAAWEEGRAMTFDQALALATRKYDDESGSMLTQRVPGARGRPRMQVTGGLTYREHEVAALVARGITNAEIARQLVVSVRTIEMHVAHATQKLGLHTRTELAAWAIHHGLNSEPVQN